MAAVAHRARGTVACLLRQGGHIRVIRPVRVSETLDRDAKLVFKNGLTAGDLVPLPLTFQRNFLVQNEK